MPCSVLYAIESPFSIAEAFFSGNPTEENKRKSRFFRFFRIVFAFFLFDAYIVPVSRAIESSMRRDWIISAFGSKTEVIHE